ncbi:MAG: hypothetical protein ACTHY7_02405 [Marinobacter sp.]|uniref:hypothetical protein n=1 Tax=Marinobacter sp. TaxID=50741 RepID=UPI003F987B45
MKFTAISFTFFALMSPVALADKPHAIPGGASAIESPPFTLSASDRNSASTTRQASSFDKAPQQRLPSFAPASLKAPKAARTMEKHEAPKIKARSVIADSNS